MSIIDIRQPLPEVEGIRFADDRKHGVHIASVVEKWSGGDHGEIRIKDISDEYIVIADKAHADNLRKALNEAERLGWLK